MSPVASSSSTAAAAAAAAITPKSIVIVGGGIIGVCTAYYTSISPRYQPSRGDTITLVEATEVASAASGKAGGLLALDWHGQATASLSALSYKLHADLAAEHGGDKWGYRTVDTLSVTTDLTERTKRKSPIPWLPEGTVHHSRALGTQKTTAQVHPQLFTRELFRMFLERPGSKVVYGSAAGISGSDEADRRALRVQPRESGEESTLPFTHLVLAAGPWTGTLTKTLFPASSTSFFSSSSKTSPKKTLDLAISGSRAHSIVLKTDRELTAHALFTDMTLEDGDMAEPEVYARPDGTVYICGASDNEPLPKLASQVKPDPFSIELLHTQASALTPEFSPAKSKTIAEQACFLPVSDRGRPLIGPTALEGVYVASGHSCWGITQGPGTGLVMSEILLEGKAKSADVAKLMP